MEYIPGSQSTQAKYFNILNSVLTDANTATDEHDREVAFKAIYLFQRIFLFFPPRSKRTASINAMMRARVDKVLAGRANELVQEQFAQQQAEPAVLRPINSRQQDEQFRIRQAEKLAHAGEFSRAAQRLESNLTHRKVDTVEEWQETIERMFPKDDSNLIDPADSGAAQQLEELADPAEYFTEIDLRRKIMSAKRKTAPGFSLWRMEHMQAAVSRGNVLPQLYLFEIQLVKDKCPASMRPYFNAQRSILFNKPDGSIRPVMVGEPLSSTGASTLVKRHTPAVRAIVQPEQFGIGFKGGAEIVTHAVHVSLNDNPALIVHKDDIDNAYGNISRAAAKEHLHSNPTLHPFKNYFNFMYGHKDNLVIGTTSDGTVKFLSGSVTDGLFQGEPLAASLTALVINPALKATAAACPAASIYGIVDDVIMVTSRDQAGLAAKAYKTALAEIRGGNVRIKESKSTMYSPSTLTQQEVNTIIQEATYDIKHDPQGIKLLGSVSTVNPEYAASFLEAKLEKHNALLDRIPKMSTHQVQYPLLRYCAAQKLSYLVRTVVPEQMQKFAQRHDDNIRNTFEAMLNRQLSNEQWQQATLPISCAGLGLGSAVKACQSGFLASHLNAITVLQSTFREAPEATPSRIQPAIISAISRLHTNQGSALRQSLEETISNIASKFNNYAHANDSLLPLPITHEAKAFIAEVTSLYPASITLPAITENINPEKFQHHVHMVYTVDDFKEVFGRANEEECARLISQTQPGAGAFLQVVPLEPALRLSNNEFDYAVCRWLNIKGCTTASSIAHCACNANITPTELHLEGQCNCGPGRIERHDNMTREVRSMLQNAGCTVPPREPRAQVVGLGNGGGDIEVRGINKQGHIEVYDVQITHPQLPSNLQAGSARVPRAAITKEEDSKRNKYEAAYQSANIVFRPLVWEVPGGFSDIIIKLISRCAKLAGNQLPTGVAQTWTTTKFSQYWMQRLSVALQRNTARMVLQAVARLQRDYSGYMPDPSAAAYFGNGSDMRTSNQMAAVAVALAVFQNGRNGC